MSAKGQKRYAAGCDVHLHAQRGIKAQRGLGKHDADGSIIRWCFADAETAAAFSAEFFFR
jgi:hypothetical protein